MDLDIRSDNRWSKWSVYEFLFKYSIFNSIRSEKLNEFGYESRVIRSKPDHWQASNTHTTSDIKIQPQVLSLNVYLPKNDKNLTIEYFSNYTLYHSESPTNFTWRSALSSSDILTSTPSSLELTIKQRRRRVVITW